MSPLRCVRSIYPRLLLSALTTISLTAGCISTRQLATLPDGEVLYVSESVLFGSRPISVGVIKTDGHRIEVRARSTGRINLSDSAYEVRQSDDQVTVWYTDHRKKVPLGAIHVNEQGQRWTLPFVPLRKQAFGATRLACRTHRTLLDERLDNKYRVQLKMTSTRDVGKSNGNQDVLRLQVDHRERVSFWRHDTMSSSEQVAHLIGEDCLADPLANNHPFELRKELSGKGVWVVNRDTLRIIGGFDREAEKLFIGDQLPDWLTALSVDASSDFQVSVVTGK